MKQEFNFDWDRGFATESPRELYAKFHTLRIDVYLPQSQNTEISGNWALVENGEMSPELANVAKLQSNYGYSRISVPVEGWFAKNAKLPTAQYTLGQAPITRPHMHFFYVVGRPETAIIVRLKGDLDWNPEIDETSNKWFKQYFKGKVITLPSEFKNLPRFERTAAGIMKSLIASRNFGHKARVILDGAEETIVYLKLHTNKL